MIQENAVLQTIELFISDRDEQIFFHYVIQNHLSTMSAEKAAEPNGAWSVDRGLV
jgi:hypothetical protein